MTTTAADYTCTIQVPVTANEALEKISRVSEWWAKSFEGSARSAGDKFTVRFGDTFVDFEVTEAVAGKRAVWQVTNCNLHWLQNKTEWNGTTVRFEISSRDGLTTVDFTHVGVTPESECFKTCEPGWTGNLQGSLRQLMISGKGLPQ